MRIAHSEGGRGNARGQALGAAAAAAAVAGRAALIIIVQKVCKLVLLIQRIVEVPVFPLLPPRRRCRQISIIVFIFQPCSGSQLRLSAIC